MPVQITVYKTVSLRGCIDYRSVAFDRETKFHFVKLSLAGQS